MKHDIGMFGYALVMLVAVSLARSASAQITTTDTETDTGAVLLTSDNLARMDTVSAAFKTTVAAHPELDAKKISRADPYYIARTPLLAAVVQQSGWTPMHYYRVSSAYVSALEQCMFTIFGLPQGTTIADKNIRFVCAGVTAYISVGDRRCECRTLGHTATHSGSRCPVGIPFTA